MDFIFGLTPVTHGYDVIFVCVDKLSKLTHFTPTMIHAITKEMARLFCDHLYELHVLSKVLLSDIDVGFTSMLWNALHGLLGTRLAMPPHFILKHMDVWNR